MENIQEIFNGLERSKTSQIINKIDIDWGKHVLGIVHIAKILEPKYVTTEEIKPILKNLLLYFTGNPESEYDLNKGIALLGGVGVGKSLLFHVFKQYTMGILKTNSFRMFTAQEIVDNVEAAGVECLAQFGTLPEKPMTAYFDDVASANEIINHYGTKTNVMEKVLTMRYDVFKKYNKLTHISSNQFPTQLNEIYGIRIVDRMKEMFNLIELNGKSHRI